MMQKREEPKQVGRHTRTRPPSAVSYQAIKVPVAAVRQPPSPAMSSRSDSFLAAT